MQPNGPQINNRYKTSLSTDKWIQFCEWNQNEFKFGQGMMHLCQCARITTTGQSPWVNAIHPVQGSFMSWRVNFRKAWSKRVNRFNTPERMGKDQLHHIETSWKNDVLMDILVRSRIGNIGMRTVISNHLCEGGGGGGLLVISKRRTFGSALNSRTHHTFQWWTRTDICVLKARPCENTVHNSTTIWL